MELTVTELIQQAKYRLVTNRRYFNTVRSWDEFRFVMCMNSTDKISEEEFSKQALKETFAEQPMVEYFPQFKRRWKKMNAAWYTA